MPDSLAHFLCVCEKGYESPTFPQVRFRAGISVTITTLGKHFQTSRGFWLLYVDWGSLWVKSDLLPLEVTDCQFIQPSKMFCCHAQFFKNCWKFWYLKIRIGSLKKKKNRCSWNTRPLSSARPRSGAGSVFPFSPSLPSLIHKPLLSTCFCNKFKDNYDTV